ncbi:zf-HC2 domain-containing protein, partial [Tsukamurella soli]
MDCEIAREALSARLDGEDEGVAPRLTDDHVAGCADCQAWLGDVERTDEVLFDEGASRPGTQTPLSKAPEVPAPRPASRRGLWPAARRTSPGTGELTVPAG